MMGGFHGFRVRLSHFSYFVSKNHNHADTPNKKNRPPSRLSPLNKCDIHYFGHNHVIIDPIGGLVPFIFHPPSSPPRPASRTCRTVSSRAPPCRTPEACAHARPPRPPASLRRLVSQSGLARRSNAPALARRHRPGGRAGRAVAMPSTTFAYLVSAKVA